MQNTASPHNVINFIFLYNIQLSIYYYINTPILTAKNEMNIKTLWIVAYYDNAYFVIKLLLNNNEN